MAPPSNRRRTPRRKAAVKPAPPLRPELIDAVTAVSSAETSLQTVIAIRDQVINAYQEIMRMPI